MRIFQLVKCVNYPYQTQSTVERHDTIVKVIDVARTPGFTTVECDANWHYNCQDHYSVDRCESRER